MRRHSEALDWRRRSSDLESGWMRKNLEAVVFVAEEAQMIGEQDQVVERNGRIQEVLWKKSQ